MGDLLQHLIFPSSQESFHTANGDEPPSAPAVNETAEAPRLKTSQNENACSTATIHTTALQAAGLPVFDINEYLSSPATQAILDSSPARKHKTSQHQLSKSSSSTGPPFTIPTEPVQLGGPKTSHFVSLLNNLCQLKGLTPVFEILDHDGGFGGKLLVAGETVEREGTWATKKEAREKLAESGVEVVRNLASTPAGSSGATGDNWVGRLGGNPPPFSPALPAQPTPDTPSPANPPPLRIPRRLALRLGPRPHLHRLRPRLPLRLRSRHRPAPDPPIRQPDPALPQQKSGQSPRRHASRAVARANRPPQPRRHPQDAQQEAQTRLRRPRPDARLFFFFFFFSCFFDRGGGGGSGAGQGDLRPARQRPVSAAGAVGAGIPHRGDGAGAEFPQRGGVFPAGWAGGGGAGGGGARRVWEEERARGVRQGGVGVFGTVGEGEGCGCGGGGGRGGRRGRLEV